MRTQVPSILVPPPPGRSALQTALEAVNDLATQLQELMDSLASPAAAPCAGETSLTTVAKRLRDAAKVVARVSVALLHPELSELVERAAAGIRVRSKYGLDESDWADICQDAALTLLGRMEDLSLDSFEHFQSYFVRVLRRRELAAVKRRRREAARLDRLARDLSVECPARDEAPPFDPVAFAKALDAEPQPVAPIRMSDLFNRLREGGVTLEQLAQEYEMSIDKLRTMLLAIQEHRKYWQTRWA